MLQDYSIYTHKLTAEKYGDFPLWNSLHLIQLDQPESATHLIEALKYLQPFPAAIVVRQELLVSTPGSHFPSLRQSAKRWFRPMQVVEHVDVMEDKLHEFRDIMEHRNGPAMNYIMIRSTVLFINEDFTSMQTLRIAVIITVVLSKFIDLLL